MPGISDLGGPVIDLQGESFVISNPIRFPPNIGNLMVRIPLNLLNYNFISHWIRDNLGFHYPIPRWEM